MTFQIFNTSNKKIVQNLSTLIQGNSSDPHLKYLIRFIFSELSAENIIFLLYASQFKKNPSVTFFKFIFDNFISSGSVYEVNLSSPTIAEIKKIENTTFSNPVSTNGRRGRIISSFNCAALDKAFTEIATLIKNDSYSRIKTRAIKSTIPFHSNFFTVNSDLFEDGQYLEDKSKINISSQDWLKFDSFRNLTQTSGFIIPPAILNIKNTDFNIIASAATITATSTANSSYSSGW